MVSSSSRMPPGGSQWPLSRRRTARSCPASFTTAAATLTECRGLDSATGCLLRYRYNSSRPVDQRRVPSLSSIIDPTSDRPAYRQIADQLRAVIVGGRLEPGAQLPSERALMDTYRAARGTVRQAIATLRAEGLVDIEHGRGAFVRRRPPVQRKAYDRFARRHRDAGKAAYLIGNGRRLVADGRSGPTGIGGSSVELPSSVGQRGRACNATDGADASLVGNICIVVMPPRHRRLSLRRSPTTHQQRLLLPFPHVSTP